MTTLLLFVGAGVATYLLRVSFVAFAGRGLPESMHQHLRLIAPATLASIVAAQLFVDDQRLTWRPDWVIAGLVAAAVAYRWKSAALTMGTGVAAALLLAPLF